MMKTSLRKRQRLGSIVAVGFSVEQRKSLHRVMKKKEEEEVRAHVSFVEIFSYSVSLMCSIVLSHITFAMYNRLR